MIFDLDGTLSTSGSFSPCLTRATREVLDISISKEDQEKRIKSGVSFTNWLHDVVNNAGIFGIPAEEATAKILSSAVNHFKQDLLASPVKPLSGATSLLKELSSRDDIIIGIVTNNLEEVTALKLKSSGLISFFERDKLVESCEDIREKEVLIGHLIDCAEEKFKVKFSRRDIYYIGDQVSDVKAGKLAGVRTIGVATGRATLCELEESGADLVLVKLTNSKILSELAGPRQNPMKTSG